MGNEHSRKNSSKSSRKSTRNTELIDMSSYNDQCGEEEYIERLSCCWLERTTIKKRKIIWENNFIAHCNLIKTEFGWASEMTELVFTNLKSKGPFFKEVNNLKMHIRTQSETDREILVTPSEVEQFKHNLKRSVLLSSSQANKYCNESSHKISASMNRPSRIDFSRFNSPNRSSMTSKKMERSPSISSTRSGLRKSIMSFVDDTLSSVFGNDRQISKQMADSLQIFLKFSMILQKHFNDPQCMLSHIKRKFIDYVCKTYANAQETSLKISQFVDSINQFMTILKEAVIDYYILTSFSEGEMFPNSFIANEENIFSLCRTIFFKEKQFYDIVFNVTVKYNEEREEVFSKMLQYLDASSPERFYVKDKFCLNKKTIDNFMKSSTPNPSGVKECQVQEEYDPYHQCKLILNELQKSMTPVNKMKIILSCSQMMNREIQKFYESNGLSSKKWVLDADQVLSVFCYLIVSAKISHLHSHLFILDSFSTSSQMISIFGYYLSVMNCAVEQLESDYLDKYDSPETANNKL